MGSAYQCDRCGKLYTSKYNTCIELTKFNGEFRNVKFDCGLNPDIDLCDDCQASFLHWWSYPEEDKMFKAEKEADDGPDRKTT